MTTCRGSIVEAEIVDIAKADMVLQTPNDPATQHFTSEQEVECTEEETSAVAYHIRTKDKDQSKPKMVIDRLKSTLKTDLEYD